MLQCTVCISVKVAQLTVRNLSRLTRAKLNPTMKYVHKLGKTPFWTLGRVGLDWLSTQRMRSEAMRCDAMRCERNTEHRRMFSGTSEVPVGMRVYAASQTNDCRMIEPRVCIRFCASHSTAGISTEPPAPHRLVDTPNTHTHASTLRAHANRDTLNAPIERRRDANANVKTRTRVCTRTLHQTSTSLAF